MQVIQGGGMDGQNDHFDRKDVYSGAWVTGGAMGFDEQGSELPADTFLILGFEAQGARARRRAYR